MALTKPTFKPLGWALAAGVWLAACGPADPLVVSQAVAGTLAAQPTQTPVVVVVTVPVVALEVVTATPPSATATPAPTATSAAPPTETAAPTASPRPTEAAASLPVPTGAPLFGDDFTTAETVWNLTEDAVQKVALADGRLSFTIKQADQFRFIYNPDRRAEDFIASVTGALPECAFRDRYGLLFRVKNNQNFYQYEVDCDGRLRLSKTVNGVFAVLKDWAPTTAAQTGSGAVNELRVRAEGGALTFYVNGIEVSVLRDEAFEEGGFGLYVGSNPAGAVTAFFDDFRVWEITP